MLPEPAFLGGDIVHCSPTNCFLETLMFHIFSIRLILNGGNAGRFWVLTTTLGMGGCIGKDFPFWCTQKMYCVWDGVLNQPTKKNCHPNVSFQEVSIQKHKLNFQQISCFFTWRYPNTQGVLERLQGSKYFKTCAVVKQRVHQDVG